MARLYNSGRTLLDPSLLQMANNAVNERLRRDAERRAPVVSSIRDLLKSGAGTISDWRAEKTRENEVSQWDIGEDPVAKAAREEYIRTGNSGPLMNYRMQKMAADQRAADAAQRKIDEEKERKWRQAVRIGQARPEYSKILKDMYKSVDEGDLETAEIYKKQLEALETEFGSDAFGDTAQSMLDTRAKQKQLADQKAAEEARLERMSNNMEKEFADKSYNQRIWFETNVIPGLKNVQDKAQAKEQVERIASNLTDEDRKALHAKIDSTETLGEKKKKSVEGELANKAAAATGEAIDTTKNKNSAKSYDGKTLVGADWKNIPDDVKKFLSRDANGVVKYIGG